MSINEYVCLTCGSVCRFAEPEKEHHDAMQCPECKSANLVELNHTKLKKRSDGG